MHRACFSCFHLCFPSIVSEFPSQPTNHPIAEISFPTQDEDPNPNIHKDISEWELIGKEIFLACLIRNEWMGSFVGAKVKKVCGSVGKEYLLSAFFRQGALKSDFLVDLHEFALGHGFGSQLELNCVNCCVLFPLVRRGFPSISRCIRRGIPCILTLMGAVVFVVVVRTVVFDFVLAHLNGRSMGWLYGQRIRWVEKGSRSDWVSSSRWQGRW